MIRNLLLICLLITSVAIVECPAAIAQNLPTNETSKGIVVLTKLSDPIFPAIARTAHIYGDVVLDLEIRQDGSVESAVVVSGPPLLQRAALTSAQQSQFRCDGCSAEPTSYRLVYTFQLVDSDCCAEGETKTTDAGPPATYPQITQSQNHVTIVDQTVCLCDPRVDIVKVRSVKCLFLWRCASRRITFPPADSFPFCVSYKRYT